MRTEKWSLAGRLKGRRIFLYGAGNGAERFLAGSGLTHKVEFLIDRRCGGTLRGIPIFSYAEKKEELHTGITLITVDRETTYQQIAEMLSSDGLIEFKDYFPADLMFRQLAVLYGNCHMEPLADCLCGNISFSRRYYVKRYYVADEKQKNRMPDRFAMEAAALFISQDLRPENEMGCISADAAAAWGRGRYLKIINTFGCNLFWPQAELPDYSRMMRHVRTEGREIELYKAGNILGWQDRNIERMYMLGKDASEILKCMEDDDLYEAVDIKKRFDDSVQKLKKREMLCDVGISDYILRHFQTIQLFYDPRHPSNALLREMARRILTYLGIDGEPGISIKELDGNEIPVYGCVRRALGIMWKQEYIRVHDRGTTIRNFSVTPDEYVQDYLLWDRNEER